MGRWLALCRLPDGVHREVPDALPPGERGALTAALTTLADGLLTEPQVSDKAGTPR